MRRIPLSQGKFALVDDEDFETLSRLKWHAVKIRSNFYAARKKVGGPMIYMHRSLLGDPPGMVCDHINGDGLDNRRSNLRLCTDAENRKAFRKKTSGHSKYRGVTRSARDGRWYAYISLTGKHTHLGVFRSEVDAARAYDRAAITAGRTREALNFPNEATEATP